MNKETDDARWQGEVDTTLRNMRERIERLEKRFMDVIRYGIAILIGIATLYFRTVGIIP